jgi:hypothetical protein
MVQQVSAENQLSLPSAPMKGGRRCSDLVDWDRAVQILLLILQLSQFWWGGQIATIEMGTAL